MCGRDAQLAGGDGSAGSPRTCKNSWLRAKPLLGARQYQVLVGLIQPLSIPGRPGPTLPWTLSRDFHRPRGAWSSLPLWTGSARLLILSCCQSFPPLWRRPPDLLTRFSSSTEFWSTSCPTGGCNSPLRICRAFAKALRASISLSSGYHPQSNGKAKRANQDLELALHCMATCNPSTWSQHLPWVEYAHNTLTCSATGLSPFESSLGYQPAPRTPAPGTGALNTVVLSGPARPGRQLGQRRSAPKIPAGAQLSTTVNLPLPISWSVGLVVHPEHSAGSQVPQGHPHFIFPFPVKDIINPFVVRLTLPGSVRIHSIFHLPHFKPVCTSSLVVSVCL